MLFAQPQHVTLEADKHGKPHLVVQLGKRPKPGPTSQDKASSVPSIRNAAGPKKQSSVQPKMNTPKHARPLSQAKHEALITAVVGKMREQLASLDSINSKSILIMYNKLKELEVGSYKDINKKGKVGDRLEGDHIPSAAAIIKALSKEIGQKIPEDKRREIINSTNVLVVSEELHRQSLTYGGRNKNLSQQDCENLLSAAERDMVSVRNKLLDKGHSKSEVNAALEKLHKPIRRQVFMILEKKVQDIESKVVNALGQYLGEINVETLLSVFPKEPIIDDKPVLNDGSDMTNYVFHNSGALLGFDLSNRLEYVYFYLVKQDSFQACAFNILPNISKETTKKEVLEQFGLPNKRRSNEDLPYLAKLGTLILGKINDWFVYDKGTYCLRFEFNDETDRLEKISFILAGTVSGYDLKD